MNIHVPCVTQTVWNIAAGTHASYSTLGTPATRGTYTVYWIEIVGTSALLCTAYGPTNRTCATTHALRGTDALKN